MRVSLSFRTRLFLSAALIVAVVLATVMILGWSRVLAVEVERLDERLCLEARRLAAQPPRAGRLADFEADSADKLHLASPAQLLIGFAGADGLRRLQSSQWPAAFEPATLAWRAAANQPGPLPPRAPPARAERPREDGRGRPPWDVRAGPPDRPGGGPADGPPDQARIRNADGAAREPLNPPRDINEEGPPTDAPERAAPNLPPPRGSCSLAAFTGGGRDWHAAKYELPFAQSFIAADLAATKAELQSALTRALAIVVPLALVMTALGAWLLASLMMRPVNRLREAMRGVTQQALDRRLPKAGEDREFAELIDAYNTMLARLEASFRQASRFSADAAHELKTPLTILQGKIEQAVANSDRRAIQSDLTQMQDEVGRLTMITRKLLLLSQADAGRLALHRTRIDMTELLDALMADAQMLASEQKIISAIERGLATEGDAVLLRQLFNNLISNALRYCPAGGWIKVAARQFPAGLDVIFANASRPIPQAERQRFFDRFYRGDAAHNRQIDGTGLGLSLAREIARAHGGELTLEPGPAEEVRFRVWLPHQKSAPHDAAHRPSTA